jgi:hypothetical protein
MPATSQLVIPVKTGIQEHKPRNGLDPGVRRGDELLFGKLLTGF